MSADERGPENSGRPEWPVENGCLLAGFVVMLMSAFGWSLIIWSILSRLLPLPS